MKIQKKKFFLGGGCRGEGSGGQGEGLGWGGQGGNESRIEVFFGKFKKKHWGGGVRGSGWWGVRMDVNEELNFF